MSDNIQKQPLLTGSPIRFLIGAIGSLKRNGFTRRVLVMRSDEEEDEDDVSARCFAGLK